MKNIDTNSASPRGAGIMIINNTCSDISMFDSAILDAILAGGVLPPELADMFVLTHVVGYPGRWRVEWCS